MDQEIAIKIEGLKRTSEVGLPKQQYEGDDIVSVYFLEGNGTLTFRLGTYNVREKYFRSDNGYGGEIWDPKDVIAWNYWITETEDGDTIDGVKVSIL